MSVPSRSLHRARAAALGLALVAGIAAVVVVNQRPTNAPPAAPAKSAEEQAPQDFPIPGFATSPYLNTRPEAKAIGTAACAKCHPGNHASYLRTTHSRALADVDPGAEPPDGSFVHKATGRTYRVFRKDGQLHHEELLKAEDGKEVGRISLPVRYLVGSGNFSRTYLVEVDGFLHESPITWYTSKKAWDLSPGYATTHAGFERPVGTACMSCHAGAVEEVGGAMHRLKIHEKAVGCENCHGPGSLHQEFHQRKQALAGDTDWTIVNPGKL